MNFNRHTTISQFSSSSSWVKDRNWAASRQAAFRRLLNSCHLDALRPEADAALLNDQRGYQTFDITPLEWRTDVKVMDRVQTPGGALSTLVRFAVNPDRPELHKA